MNKCPKCGDFGTRRNDGVYEGHCWSMWDAALGGDAPVMRFQSDRCRIRELEAQLAAMTLDRDSWCDQADQRTKDALEEAARADKAEGELAACDISRRAIKDHMDYCRSLLGVPDDEVLAASIEEMKSSLSAANQRIRELTDALVSIGEYWNRDNNERAMEDACWHAVNTVESVMQERPGQ